MTQLCIPEILRLSNASTLFFSIGRLSQNTEMRRPRHVKGFYNSKGVSMVKKAPKVLITLLLNLTHPTSHHTRM